MRRLRLPLAALALFGLLLTGCSGGDEPSTSDSPASEAPASEAPAPESWPLTGLPVEEGSAALDHPVYVAKIDNTSSSAPQVGLGRADLVVEELVEGGITRLAVFFYSQLPDQVGPLRSMRYSDVGIVAPVDADIVTSGGAPSTVQRITDAGLGIIDMNNAALSRDPSRPSLYSVMGKLQDIAAEQSAEPAAPQPYLPWGTEQDFPKGKRATSIEASFSASHTTRWTYGRDSYVLAGSFQREGDTFSPETVITLEVETRNADYLDPAGNPVPETVFEGQGDAVVFHGGTAVKATWHKDGLDAPVTFTTKAGDLTIPAGHVWMELVPRDGGTVTYR